VFGHSYGGLIALEAARRSEAFSDIIAYEPAVSVDGSIPASWMPLYRRRLDVGDPRGAFAAMVRGMGAGPQAIKHLPLWYLKLILRGVIKEEEWRIKEPLLEAGYAEHQQVAAVDEGNVARYRSIAARVLLLGGSNSPTFLTTALFDRLTAVIATSTSELIDGLDHLAPERRAPVVAAHVRRVSA
jgi:pimeloyl-ACP methyl ester carboxylesterase